MDAGVASGLLRIAATSSVPTSCCFPLSVAASKRPSAPRGCGGAGPSAASPLLPDAPRHRLRRGSLHPTPRRSQRRLTPFFYGLLGPGIALAGLASNRAARRARGLTPGIPAGWEPVVLPEEVNDEQTGGSSAFAPEDRGGVALHLPRRHEAVRLVRGHAGSSGEVAAASARGGDYRGHRRHVDRARALHAASGVHRVRRDGLCILHGAFPERILADPESGPARRPLLFHLPVLRGQRTGTLQPGSRDPAPPGCGESVTAGPPDHRPLEACFSFWISSFFI